MRHILQLSSKIFYNFVTIDTKIKRELYFYQNNEKGKFVKKVSNTIHQYKKS